MCIRDRVKSAYNDYIKVINEVLHTILSEEQPVFNNKWLGGGGIDVIWLKQLVHKRQTSIESQNYQLLIMESHSTGYTENVSKHDENVFTERQVNNFKSPQHNTQNCRHWK